MSHVRRIGEGRGRRVRHARWVVLLAGIAWWCGLCVLAVVDARAADGNRLAPLDENNPWACSGRSPKLVTPQWVGEPGVECVVTLGIDDMRDPAVYEKYLRPILDRLKKIDGRAPVSIFTCKVDPESPQLQTWLAEGLSFEVHTTTHPCPLLCKNDLAAAKATYDDCIDLLARIPGNNPVAYRMPCCDSLNTLGPRFYAEIFPQPTRDRHFLRMSSSVFTLFTANDPTNPRDLVLDEQGNERFRLLVPKGVKAMGKQTEHFVNWIEDYPYPFVINRLCWEFPGVVPTDWSSQHARGPNNPATVEDWKRALDLTVMKQGVFNLVFHPHNWIKPEQVVELIDHAVAKHGSKVKFLTFREALDRIERNLLDDNPLRADNGQDNGVRILDVNADGYMDVLIGTEKLRRSKVWDPAKNAWRVSEFPTRFVQVDQNNRHHDAQVRFGVVREHGFATVAVSTSSTRRAWDFDGERWQPNLPLRQLFTEQSERASSGELGVDLGLRFRDLDGDGVCEIVAANPQQRSVWRFDREAGAWRDSGWSLPPELVVANLRGRDNGARFVDLNDDGGLDLIVSNEKLCGVWLFDTSATGWSKRVLQRIREDASADEMLPAITRDGSDQGFAAREGELIWINEGTDNAPDMMERRRFVDLVIAEGQLPGPRSPTAGLKSLRVAPGYTVELVASEPLITDPVYFTWDEQARLWVVEMRDYPNGCPEGGRIRILTDTNNDGVYDSGTTFLEGIAFPTGLQPWQGGAIVCAAPDVFFARDDDGDGRADTRTVLFTGFAEGNQQHRVNGPVYALDNRLHCANGDSGGTVRSAKTGDTLDIRGRDFSFDPETGAMRAETGQTQFGRTRDPFGNWFGNNNSNPLYQYVLEDRYVARNPHVAAPSLRVDVPEVAGNAPIFPLSRTLVRFNDFHTANRLTSACATHLYADRLFGADSNSLFVCEPVHNLVHRERYTEVDGLYRSTRAPGEATSEFLASTDNWFRPVYSTTGPDGAVWVADMYRLVIEHPEWIPKAWQERLDLRAGHDKGRIYRVRPTHVANQQIAPVLPDYLHAGKMVAELDHPNGWRRDTAMRLLSDHRFRKLPNREQTQAVLRELAQQGKLPESRVAALWALQSWEGLKSSDVRQALADADPRVARQGVVLLEQQAAWVTELRGELLGWVGRDRRMDRQLACSLGEFRYADEPVARLFAELATRAPTDRFVEAGLLSSLNKENLGAILEAVSGVEAAVRRDEWIVRLLEQGTALGVEGGEARLFATMTGPRDREAVTARLTRATRFFEMAARRPALARWFRAQVLDTRTDESRAMTTLGNLARATNGSLDERVAAVRFMGLSLAAIGTPAAAGSAERELLSLLNVRQPDAVQSAVIEALGGWPALIQPLAAAWPALPPARRARLLDLWLAGNETRAELATLIVREQISPADLSAAQRQQWIDRTPPEGRAQIRKLLDASPTGTRGEVVATALRKLPSEGEAARGAKLFEKSCAACHKFAGVGQEIGPDIASLTDRSPEALVTAILDPNRAVEAKYTQFVVETTAGLTHSGIVAAETTGSLALRLADGKELVLPRQEIETLVGTGRSLMPEGLEKDLTPRDLADLLAHLRSGVVPAKRREFAGNTPRVVVPEPGGHLRLSADACAIYGTNVVWEEKYGNLGYWSAEADRAEWSFQVTRAGRYRVVLEWACPDDAAGNGWQVESREQRLTGTVAATGTWDDYRRQPVGELTYGEGTHTLVVRSSGPVRGHLWDLKGLILEPVK